MISPVRATAIIGAGTVVTIAASVVVAKALALLIGPEGVGRFGLLHSVLTLTALVSGLGVSTALVRAIAAALASPGSRELASLRTAGVGVVLIAGTVGVVVLIAIAGPIATGILGDAVDTTEIWLLAPAALLQLIAGVELAVINGYHRITALAMAGSLGAALGGSSIVVAAAAFGDRGLALGLLTNAAIATVVAVLFRARSVGRAGRATMRDVRQNAARLTRWGAPYTLSQLAGTGSVLLVPILLLDAVGPEGVGQYRAASVISIGYLAFMLNALAQDYLPRVAGAPAENLALLIERRTRLVVVIALPLILAMLALAPLVVSVLYSDEFLPAADVLRWQLVGDILKLPAWALAFVVLARSSPAAFLGLEVVGGGVLLVGVAILPAMIGVAGAGVAYLLSYSIYFVAAWLLVQTSAPSRPGRLQLGLVLLAIACVVINLVMDPLDSLRTVVLLGLAVAVAAVGWTQLWRQHRADAFG